MKVGPAACRGWFRLVIRTRAALGAAIVVAGFIPAPGRATTVVPLSVEEIVSLATVAFEGTCVDNRSERDAGTGFIVTYTTFRVNEALKGAVGETYTIKQLGGRIPGEARRFISYGLPIFNVGDSYVVFLTGASKAGFSTAVGLGQGRFTITRDAGGSHVTNGRDLREMVATIPPDRLPFLTREAMKRRQAPFHEMGLDEFKDLVREQLSDRSAGVK